MVTAHVDGHSTTHPLDGPQGTAAELLSDLVDRARQNPVAVVQLTAEAVNEVDVRLEVREHRRSSRSTSGSPGTRAG